MFSLLRNFFSIKWQVPGMLMAPELETSGSAGSQAIGTATSCSACKEEFGFSRWKYKCKTCGNAVCSDCSPNKIETAGYTELKRACKKCENRYKFLQKARPRNERIDELCNSFLAQAEISTSTRDGVLSVANGILGALNSVVPAPFDSVVSAALQVVALAQTAATNTAESQ
jgi:hypothetical protein